MAEALEPLQKGHARSVSAGGVGALTSPALRPSALRKGHQRAFSHGQITSEEDGSGFVKGHHRIGSKTDFILPPGHREQEGGSGGAKGRAGGGHSRQASQSESIYTLRHNSPPSRFDQLASVFFRRKSKWLIDSRNRTVVPNHIVPPRTPRSSHPNGYAPSNRIRTTKYTLLSFIPKNLFEQFHRVANLYFILIVLLNWVPSINAFGKEVAMIPVLFVLGVTGVKDLFEDRRRHSSDKRINNSTCRVYSGEEERYKKTFWKEVRVGDLIHLSNNEVVPADILLLRTSDEHGTCYLDTCNLDGESNLKLRNVPMGYVEKQDDWSPSSFRSIIEVDPPTTKLYHFHGAIVDQSGGRTPVSVPHLLLRDSVIKNTDFVEGIVIYAGHETKAMLNNSGPRYKRSSLEKKMNGDIMWCVVILIVLCCLGAVGAKLWLSSFPDHFQVPYIISSQSTTIESFFTFLIFIIILQVMIPLSLYVTIEMTKLLQVFHINNNIDLYDPETNTRIECRALNITEQLGQIQYIFSDKTGTLTENKMIFRRCTIGGIDYNHPASKSSHKDSLTEFAPNSKLMEHLNETDSAQSAKIKEFLIALALCNTVIVAAHPHRDSENNQMSPTTVFLLPMQMNASGEVEPSTTQTEVSMSGFEAGGLTPQTVDQYRLLVEEPRSITPSPIPFGASLEDQSSVSSFQPGTPTSEKSWTSRTGLVNRIRGKSSIGLQSTLSPISSSAESSPTPVPRRSPSRPKLLNVPNSLMFFKKQTSKNGVSPSPKSVPKPIYEAESPDELALVKLAFIYNCKLMKRTFAKAILSLPGEIPTEYEILKILPFDSVRKMMSVVVRTPDTGEIVVYTKGADSSVFPRLVDPRAESTVEGQVGWYSSQGLRVLCIAKRIIPEASWPDLFAALRAVETTALTSSIRHQAYSAVETNLTLLGATGIEDRLQAGVSETLSSLRSAGIVVWVLTGDKVETAANVAVAAGLFSTTMETLRLTARSKQSAEAAIMFYLNEIQNSVPHRTASAPGVPRGSQPRPSRQKALIIDGKTLTFILDRRSNLLKPFLELTKCCTAVLCCRVTPLQKAFIVKVVKEQLRMRTLAIGDGANDVSMIQAADVGIGISGEEGMQAVMASDFAIARFRFLLRLLLVHGHWSYHRLSNMVLYFFYKNATFVFLIFWFQLYCGFSGTVMIDQMYHMLYNLFFIALPPFAIGVYDQDAPQSLLLSKPSLYNLGRLSLAYTEYSFWITTLDSIYQSLVIFFISVGAYSDSTIGLWEFGTTITSSCMFAMLMQMALETKSWTILHVASLVLSLGIFYAFCLVYNSICMQCYGLPSNTWVLSTTLGDPSYWLIVGLSAITALLPRFVFRALQSVLFPDDVTKALKEYRRVKNKGDNFLVSWSRSTSTSSIHRTGDGSRGTQPPLAAVG